MRILGQFVYIDGSVLGEALKDCDALAHAATEATAAARRAVEAAGDGSAEELAAAAADVTAAARKLAANGQAGCRGPTMQLTALRAIDMLLTTCVVAGGAKGFHEYSKWLAPAKK